MPALRQQPQPLVGRLAPSPTGRLHLGHARTFLLAWWSIRSRGGRIVLRLEDLDAPRARPEWMDVALRDLEWLGLDWDGEPLVQSRGMDRLRSAIESLVSEGLAYACVCSRADVRTAASAPQLGETEIRYPGTCRERFSSIEQARSTTGRDASLRFKSPSGSVELHDELVGAFRSDPQAEVGDFMVARRDGTPAYQLAVVVDDADQGITEVLRGDDLLPSTARQWQLQRALGLPQPRWIHVPLVVDEHGRRLAKRADDLSLAELRDAGVDPRAIVGWAASTSGMSVPERLTAKEALATYTLANVPTQPVHLTGERVRMLLESR